MKIYLNNNQNEALAKIEKFTQPSSLRWVIVDKDEADNGSFYRKISKLEFHPYLDDISSRPCWILGDLIGFVDNCIKQGYEWKISMGNTDYDTALSNKNEVIYINNGVQKKFHKNDELIDNLYDAIINFLTEK